MRHSGRGGRRDTWVKRIGHRRGAPRIFLDAAQAARAGFSPNERFEVDVDGTRVVISKCSDGAHTVSTRRRGDEALPVIDINNKDLAAVFAGMDCVRVIVEEARVYLLPLASELKRVERLRRLSAKVASGEPLLMGSLSHGGGVLAHAIHAGLAEAGLKPELAFVNEIREDLVEQAIRANDVWGDRTAAIVMAMQEAVQDDWLMSSLPKVEILEMGLPCSGASRAGATKRALKQMEDHPEVGHLVFSALVILSKVQPAIVLLENVPDYASSASASILRQQLRDMGFDTHEAILEGKDFGCLENRVRWCLVAVTRGVDFDFDRIAPSVRVIERLGAKLDSTIGTDDPRWRSYAGLKAKAQRDLAKGKGFKMQVVDADAISLPTLRKGYHKAGSTDPLLRHPDDPSLMRLLTAAEHARVKGVPEHIVEGLSETVAHQLLGQGIAYAPFRAVGRRIGERIVAAVARRRAVDAQAASGDRGPEDAPVVEDTAASLRRQRAAG